MQEVIIIIRPFIIKISCRTVALRKHWIDGPSIQISRSSAAFKIRIYMFIILTYMYVHVHAHVYLN